MVMDVGGWTPPSGWSVETYDWMPDCIVIWCALYGWVTIDMKNRIFCPGLCRPTKWNSVSGEESFKGRGWRRQIMKSAENFLRSVVDGQP